jgi:hypothetical protein
MKSPPAAWADFPSNAVRMSIRPGITPDEIKREMLSKKDMDSRQRHGLSSAPQYFQLDHEQDVDVHTKNDNDMNKETDKPITTPDKKVKRSKALEYDDDYLDLEDEEVDVETVKPKESKRKTVTSIAKKAAAMDASQRKSGVVQTVSSLSGAGPKLSAKAENAMVKKAILAMFGPVLGVCFLREADRWNKEQKSVDKRIELLKIQRDEMKKQGSSSTDEKKKDPGGKDDDKDEDDDDDDDDDEDEDDDKKNKTKK